MREQKKTILSLCSGTGAWEKPYVDADYNVIPVTLPGHDVRTYQPPDDVYGIFAAPPCTMFSLARTVAKTPRDFEQGMETVVACLNIIWMCRYVPKYRKDGALKFWALENPMGFLRQFLGMPYLTFNPCDYGDPYTKKTDVWGYFNKPKQSPYQMTKQEKDACVINNRKLPSIGDFTGSGQAVKRAITPPGFARAFFEANR